jgi:pimeloyl-ACP methyl ester carboxylesterase
LATGTHSIFISYDRADAEIARRIRIDLTRRGASTWMDEFDVPPGAYWPDEIDKGLGACTTVVGLLSPDAIASRNVKNEWDWALFNNRRLLLVLVRPCTVPHRYISLNWIDATQVGLDSALESLATAAGFAMPHPDADRPVLPVTRYTRSGDGNVAWQMFGDGPIDLVLTPGAVSHLEHNWTNPSQAAWLLRLGTLTRVAAFDKRGTGLSDRVGRVLTLEERVDDIRAVMDAAGFERAVIFGISEGGSLAALFAATHPERTIGLMIYGGLASYVARPDYPWPPTYDEYKDLTEEFEVSLHERWGTDEFAREIVEMVAPSGANEPYLISWMAGLMRLGGSPGAEVARRKMNIELDARSILPAISVPSIVLHRTGDADVNIEEGRYIAAHIPGCRFVELPGNDHFEDLGDQQTMFAAIESFLGGLTSHDGDAGIGQKLATAVCLNIPLGVPQLTDTVSETVRMTIAGWDGTIVEPGPRRIIILFSGSIRAMRCAQSIRDALNANDLEGRFGIHSGAVGTEIAPGGATGVAVRLASMAATGAIIVTESVKNISPGSGFTFEPLGKQEFATSEPSLDLYRLIEREADGTLQT